MVGSYSGSGVSSRDLIRVFFPATESQRIFRSPAWPTATGGAGAGHCLAGSFGSGYAGLQNIRAKNSMQVHPQQAQAEVELFFSVSVPCRFFGRKGFRKAS